MGRDLNGKGRAARTLTVYTKSTNPKSIHVDKTQNQYQATAMERTERIPSAVVAGKCEFSNTEPWSEMLNLERCGRKQTEYQHRGKTILSSIPLIWLFAKGGSFISVIL